MPIYDYQCKECGATYDVLHKVREVIEDVVCPSCHSNDHVRLISAPNVAVSTSASVQSSCATPDACCGGSCGLN